MQNSVCARSRYPCSAMRAALVGKTKQFDPSLPLDDFRNDNPADYLAGFPWQAHRGIETITYVLAGSVEHGDSLGHKGKMTAGDLQWMTAQQRIDSSISIPLKGPLLVYDSKYVTNRLAVTHQRLRSRNSF